MSRLTRPGRTYSPEFITRAEKLAGALYAVAYNESLGDCEFADLPDEEYQANYLADAIDVLNLMPHLLPFGCAEHMEAFA